MPAPMTAIFFRDISTLSLALSLRTEREFYLCRDLAYALLE